MLTTPIALHVVKGFSSIDFSSMAAILAAIGTLVLAFFTWRLAVQTRKLADETKEDVRTSKGAVQNSIRPLLVAVPQGLAQNATTEVLHIPTRAR